jgi:hypothetical protein
MAQRKEQQSFVSRRYQKIQAENAAGGHLSGGASSDLSIRGSWCVHQNVESSAWPD